MIVSIMLFLVCRARFCCLKVKVLSRELSVWPCSQNKSALAKLLILANVGLGYHRKVMAGS